MQDYNPVPPRKTYQVKTYPAATVYTLYIITFILLAFAVLTVLAHPSIFEDISYWFGGFFRGLANR